MPDDNVWQAVPRLALQIDCRTIFDVGAHTGDITRRFLGELQKSVVYSFEADPRNFRRLKSAFDGDERVRAVHAAVSSQPGTAAFHLGANDYTSSLFPREDEMRRYYHSQYTMVDTVTVPMITLDNFCRDYGIEQIDVLKIDTQGAELDILRGAEHILDASKIQIIVTEFFFIQHYKGAPLLDEIWGLLRRHKYEIYDLFKGPHGSNGQARFGDAIFVSSRFRHSILDSRPAEP
jgi:FkbM family methyltransferase